MEQLIPKALYDEPQKVRAAADHLPREDFKTLPLDAFFYSNASTAYNTNESANQKASDISADSMINLLNGKGKDRYVVNGMTSAGLTAQVDSAGFSNTRSGKTI